MHAELHAKCSCQNCGTHLEFPIEAAGMLLDCPHCRQATLLSLNAPPAGRLGEKPAAAEILGAFQGGIRPARISLLYQAGLLLVALTMVLLPLVYLAMVMAAGPESRSGCHFICLYRPDM